MSIWARLSKGGLSCTYPRIAQVAAYLTSHRDARVKKNIAVDEAPQRYAALLIGRAPPNLAGDIFRNVTRPAFCDIESNNAQRLAVLASY